MIYYNPITINHSILQEVSIMSDLSDRIDRGISFSREAGVAGSSLGAATVSVISSLSGPYVGPVGTFFGTTIGTEVGSIVGGLIGGVTGFVEGFLED